MRFKGKTIFITGASQGIGQAMALGFAKAGANIAALAKDTPKASIRDLSHQIGEVGGQSLTFDLDVRDHQAVKEAVDQAATHFGGIDILINNTSATVFTDTLHTTAEQFDLLIATSVRAAFLTAQACIPYLKKSTHPHIINIAPPLNLDPYWFKDHLAFSISKYGMSLATLGMAEEFKKEGIAVNALWPQTTIATQTIKDHFDPQVFSGSRYPAIMADAALELAKRKITGQFFTDEALLRDCGIEDFSSYAVDPTSPLMQALFINSDLRVVSQDLFRNS